MQYLRKYPKLSGRPIVLSLLAFLFVSALSLHAQSEVEIRSLIREGDIKKLIKADEYKANADKLVEEASQLNMDVLLMQADPDLDEKTKVKKAGQIESQAQQKQIQASALYEKCSEIKFTVYKQYIDEFWKAHEGEETDYLNAKLLEEQSSDHFFQAVSFRIEAKKMDDLYMRLEKLSEANNLENEALHKQITALAAYYLKNEVPADEDTPVAETEAYLVEETTPAPEAEMPAGALIPTDILEVDTTQTRVDLPGVFAEQPVPDAIEAPVVAVDHAEIVSADITLPDKMEINQSMIDSYNRYIAGGNFNDTTLSTGKIAGITDFDTDRMLQLWYEYVYGQQVYENEQEIAETTDSTVVAEEVTPVVSTPPASGIKSEIGIVTEENRSEIVPADEEVIYRVQIAANRTELSQRALSKMYYGKKSVEMVNENGWYKYSVGDFATYEEASKFRNSTGMSNAFVVAYRKGTQFTSGITEVIEKNRQAFAPGGDQRLPAGFVFRIQVAASRIPLNMGQLKRIYTGDYPIEMIQEDGWYKYQFMGVRLYSDAIQLLKNVNTSGAFVVAYENGAKISLAEAVRNTKELENKVRTYGRKGQIQEIEFHLQFAASKIPLSTDELRLMYAGSEPISIVYEDGWYKYHLKAGNSPEMAEQLKETCMVEKAFIVPYKRAAKIGYYQAIQEIKQNSK
ncbi:MAG: SPOR domain-containing protein [Bacteroidales bacterium]|nr:SPOR domain-containing protein [Bacteroidales bacterium]